jgi:hypothetical protein
MPAKKKKDNYFQNLGKEFAQFMEAKASANSAEGQYKYRNWKDDSKTLEELKRKASRDRYLKEEKDRTLKKERNAKGQLAGALLQGRRYKGNKQVTKKKK